jgi:NAD(P)-dependent dehydrogenase (short-subunit alcohol dehydrogenase family)
MGVYAITGAASGIGKAIAEQIAADGNEVITVDIRDADINADLSDSAQVDAAVDAILAKVPQGLNGFIPCAGLGPDFGKLSALPLVNYFAVVDMVNGLLPALKKKQGSIVLISSNSSQMRTYNEDFMQALLKGDREAATAMVDQIDGQGVYGGGKQAITRWMRRVTPKLAADGVRINAIAPGYTESGMTKKGLADPVYAQSIRDFVNSIPIGRPGVPADQANAVCFLLSDKASFITGSVLFIDGGHDAVFRPDNY